MRTFTTILCSLAFLIGGIMIATSDGGGGPSFPGTATANATPTFDYGYNSHKEQPFGFSINQTTKDTVYVTKTDTVVVTGHDTVWVPKREVKYVRVPVTKTIQKTDTLYVPVSSQITQESENVSSDVNDTKIDTARECDCICKQHE